MTACEIAAPALPYPESFSRVKPGRLKEKGDVVLAQGKLLPVALEDVGRAVRPDEVVLRDIGPTRTTY